MIAVKELRVGNYILDDEGLLAKVVGLAPFEDSVRCDEAEGCQIKIDFWDLKGELRKGWAVDSPECAPIPLTPEWLERCGFERIQSNLPDLMRMPSFDGYRRLRWDYEGFSIETVGSGWIWPLRHIKCLHQLQNIFHSLTYEELNVKV